jgi:hypothetical protein
LARKNEPEIIAPIGLQVALLVGSAFFSGSETALFSLSRLDLQKLRRERNRHSETLHELLDQPRRLIISILCGNELVNIAAAANMVGILVSLYGPERTGLISVLVERVEGFATENEWRRAYAEINDFESQLIEHGIMLVKYWVHVSNEEQLERFRQRELTPYKRWKITEEDWRNREKWDDYDLAVNDLVQYTSTYDAPWTLVEGNDKRYARVKVLETLCARMEKALEKTRANAAVSASGGSEAGLDPVAPSSSFS